MGLVEGATDIEEHAEDVVLMEVRLFALLNGYLPGHVAIFAVLHDHGLFNFVG